jgi:formylglycine-generating enzyme required for sulfatase activity
MDDLGLGVDCADNGLENDVYIINNTIVNNANCPRMASLINTAGFRIITSEYSLSEINNAYTLSRYYMASTETTVGQYSCFLNAIDATVSSKNVYISDDDLSGILSANAPLSGHTSETVQAVLSIGTAVATSVSTSGTLAWDLCLFGIAASNDHGQLYYSSVSKIFVPSDAKTVESGESKHHNDYGCGNVTWYGGTAYCVWMGGMLPTVGQWYYAGCATDNSGGKATAMSHYPSPMVKTITPSNKDVSDSLLEAIAWYSYNSGPTLGSTSNKHVHQVAKKAPNSVGLYDVAGNLEEWCLDWYVRIGNTYAGGQDGVCAVSNASTRFFRGGDWMNPPIYCASSRHSNNDPYDSYYIYGFRLAVVP